jgi:desulfoferrodoxin (superoxide reductase-like protein)
MGNLLIINTDHLEEKHIGWIAMPDSDDNKMIVSEVVRRKYAHPSAPEDAVVWQTETVYRGTFHKTSPEGSAAVILNHANVVVEALL